MLVGGAPACPGDCCRSGQSRGLQPPSRNEGLFLPARWRRLCAAGAAWAHPLNLSLLLARFSAPAGRVETSIFPEPSKPPSGAVCPFGGARSADAPQRCSWPERPYICAFSLTFCRSTIAPDPGNSHKLRAMNSETRTSLQKRAAEDVTAAVELLAKLQSAAGEEDVRRCTGWLGRALGPAAATALPPLPSHPGLAAAPPSRLCSALPTCAGVAFMWVSKIGLGLGMDAGHGFVIHRRPVRLAWRYGTFRMSLYGGNVAPSHATQPPAALNYLELLQYDEAKEGEKLPNSWSAPLFFNVSAGGWGGGRVGGWGHMCTCYCPHAHLDATVNVPIDCTPLAASLGLTVGFSEVSRCVLSTGGRCVFLLERPLPLPAAC